MFSFAEDVCFRSKDEKCNTSTKRRSYKQLIFFIQSPIRLDHLTGTMCGNYMFGVLKKRVWEILNNVKSSFNYNQWLSWYRKTTRVRHIEACYSTSVSSQLTAIGFPRIVHWNREFIISCWSQRHSNFFLLQKDLKTL